MLGFNQDEYLTSARKIIAARKQAENVADDIYQSGCSALFFASVGGSLFSQEYNPNEGLQV